MCIESSYEGGARVKVHKEIEDIVARVLIEKYGCHVSLDHEHLGSCGPYGIISHEGGGRLRIDYIAEHKSVFEIQPRYKRPGGRIHCLLPVGLFGREEQEQLKQKVKELSNKYGLISDPKQHLVAESVPLDKLHEVLTKAVNAHLEFWQWYEGLSS